MDLSWHTTAQKNLRVNYVKSEVQTTGILIQSSETAHELHCKVVKFRRTYRRPSFWVAVCVVSQYSGGAKT